MDKDEGGEGGGVQSSRSSFEAALLIPGKCHYSNPVNYGQTSSLTMFPSMPLFPSRGQ